jgi:hypothetical protein
MKTKLKIRSNKSAIFYISEPGVIYVSRTSFIELNAIIRIIKPYKNIEVLILTAIRRIGLSGKNMNKDASVESNIG